MLSAAASSILSANSSPPSDHVPHEWWTDRRLGDLAAVFPACCLLSCGKISVSVYLVAQTELVLHRSGMLQTSSVSCLTHLNEADMQVERFQNR